MSILHTVNKSPFDRNTLEGCLRLMTADSAVLLLEDGVYGAMAGTSKSQMLEDAMKNVSVYVLGPDLKARGVEEGRLVDGVKVIGYDDFVDLVCEKDTVSAWL